jgi:hypothetical protein
MALVALALIVALRDIRVEVYVPLVRLLAALPLSTVLAVAQRHPVQPLSCILLLPLSCRMPIACLLTAY